MNSLLLHSSILLFFIVSWLGLHTLNFSNIRDSNIRKMKDIHFRYMTIWNFIIQTAVFSGYFMIDILDMNNTWLSSFKNKFKRKLDYCFYAVVIPTTMTVTVVFWIIYTQNPGMIFIHPEFVNKIMPSWLNHAIHSVIMINILLQTYHNKLSAVTLRQVFRSILIFSICYGICIYETYWEKHVWIYPFLNEVSEPYRFILLISIMLLSCSMYTCFHFANKLFCSSVTESINKSDKRKL